MASEESNVDQMISVFQHFNDVLSSEQLVKDSIRTITKEIEQKCRQMQTIMSQIHSSKSDITSICGKAQALMPALRSDFDQLKGLGLATSQYFQYRDFWKQSLSTVVFVSALIKFLCMNQLISLQEAHQVLGLEGVEPLSPFRIDIVDYLYGLTFIPSELSRFCVNRARVEDYDAVERCVTFMNELYAGFQLLNLKNDFLRKKYDSMKYDLKKMEEIIYDLSLRGLLKKAPPPPPPPTKETSSSAPPAPTTTTTATATQEQ